VQGLWIAESRQPEAGYPERRGINTLATRLQKCAVLVTRRRMIEMEWLPQLIILLMFLLLFIVGLYIAHLGKPAKNR